VLIAEPQGQLKGFITSLRDPQKYPYDEIEKVYSGFFPKNPTLRLQGCLNLPPLQGVNSKMKIDMPPKAKKIPHTMTTHGDTRIDNYYWLRDDERADAQVLDYLHQENDYGRQVMSTQQALQDRLLKEMIDRIPQRDVSAPYTQIATARFLKPAMNTPFINASP
jgi:hypothetical protein